MNTYFWFAQFSHREIRLRNGKRIIALWKNVLCSKNEDKTRRKIVFEIVHWPFKLPPNYHQLASPSGWIY